MREIIDRRTERGRAEPPTDLPDVYTIHIGTVLGPNWADWFAGSKIIAREDGSGIIVAAVRDQAMLFGLLLRIRDLGIPLLGVYPDCEWPLPSVLPGGPITSRPASNTTQHGGNDV